MPWLIGTPIEAEATCKLMASDEANDGRHETIILNASAGSFCIALEASDRIGVHQLAEWLGSDTFTLVE